IRDRIHNNWGILVMTEILDRAREVAVGRADGGAGRGSCWRVRPGLAIRASGPAGGTWPRYGVICGAGVTHLFAADPGALALDALAIAAQALIGKGIGAGDERSVRRVLARTVAWGGWFGVVVGIVIGALSGLIGLAFTGDAQVAALVQPALIVLAIAQPIAGVVFVLDGVLMGADDARYLAIAGGLNLIPFLPALWIIALTGVDGTAGLVWLAVAFFG